MRYVLTVLVTGMFLLGINAVSFALDLGSGQGTAESAEATLKGMAKDGEAKVKEAKGEARNESVAEKIQSKSQEKVNEKIDDMKKGLTGR